MDCNDIDYTELEKREIHRDGIAPLWWRIRQKFRERFLPYYRPKLNAEIREKLGDISFSIFSNNCLGGVFYHDAGREFTSPTVNLAFDGLYFIRFLENPEYYLSLDLIPVENKNYSFPVGALDDVEIRFVHYHSFEEAKAAWDRRKMRIVYDNLYIVATDHDGMYFPELLERFDKLPYKNKVMFTSKSYPQYPWAVQVPQFKNRIHVRTMTNLANIKGQRFYETCFDLAAWIRNNTK